MKLFGKLEKSFKVVGLSLMTVFAAEQGQAQCVPEREAYFVMDASTGAVLIEKDSDVKIQPASMAKLMTLLLAQEAVDKGLMSLDDRLYIASGTSSREDMERFSNWNGSIKLLDAMRGAGISSYNDLAATIAEFTAKAFKAGNTESAFVALMNKRAQELGMQHTEFYNASGLPTPLVRVRDGGTTTRDLAILLKHISDHMPQLVDILGTESARVKGRTLHNTNTLLRNDSIPDQDIFGKTGYTCDAGFALTAHTRRGDSRVIASFVGANNAKDREQAFLQILNQAFEKLELSRMMGPMPPSLPLPLRPTGKLGLFPGGDLWGVERLDSCAYPTQGGPECGNN